MKLRLSILLIGGALIFGALPKANAVVAFSAGVQISSSADFYTPLEPYGAWVNVGTYGRCWHPNQVGVEWRPYTVGYWEWTDAGWYWVSDEPWAWACYHYGDWYYDSTYGWVWIPGTEWAPAWVCWRYGGDYIGWAPYGPDSVVLAPSFFCFVDVHHFRNHFGPRDFIVNNTAIINQTRVVNKISRETLNVNGTPARVVVNKGPGVDPIQRATGKTFAPKPLTQVIQQTPVPQTLRQRSTRSTETQPTTQSQPLQGTGREQPRTYQQQTEPRQTTPQPVQPRTVAPSEQPKPAPEKPREVLPPTGSEQPRYREVPAPQPKPEQPAQRVAPPAAPERPLPPTGREVTPMTPPQRPEVVPPPRPVVPAQPQIPARPETPPGQERDKDRDRPF